MDYYSELYEKLSEISTQYNFEKIKKAFDYANEMHEGQFRKSGEPYISHPVAVALIVAQLELDTDSVCAALLHDTLEDCKEKTDCATIKKLFGEDVLELVDGLTKLVDIHFENREEESVENLRKMFLAMSKDIRVIFIKLADRLHNMRTLSAQPDEKQRSIALETMHVYAPLAHRLGIQKIKGEPGFPPPSFNLTTAIYHVCGAVTSTYESNEGLIANNQFTAEEILLHHYCLFESMLNLAWRE